MALISQMDYFCCMCAKIRVLNEQTINEIAAGEVIENPASVVKELVENSLDAESTEITIEIRGGGRQLIRITDNGCGMSGDDAILCLERHATSKIRSSEDIFSVSTLGFRGEAIPSIAAISKFTLLTCPKDNQENMGTLIIVDGGKFLSTGPAAGTHGTTIEVKNLFFNVPVRKKFQRSPVYDIQEIQKICIAFALCHPNVHFHLISNEETLLRTSTSEKEPLGQRIEDLLGKEYYEHTKLVNVFHEGFALEGYLGLPSLHRPNRSGQYLFVNKRFVTAPFISYNLKECYSTMLPSNRHPVFVLSLTIPTGCVDVNVHPQKREVRFSESTALKELLRIASQSFMQCSPQTLSEAVTESTFTYRDFQEQKEATFPAPSYTFPLPWETTEPPKFIFKEPEKPVQLAFNSKLSILPKILSTLSGYILLDGSSLKDTLLEGQKGSEECAFALLDQRKAHSRILFEEFLNKKVQKHEIQTLLVPYQLQLSPSEEFLIITHIEHLEKIGVTLQQIGPHFWVVESLPAFSGDLNIQLFMESLLETLKYAPTEIETKTKFIAEKLSKVISQTALSMKYKLSFEEASTLLKRLCDCQNPLFCPLGKPIIVNLSYNELQKLFS